MVSANQINPAPVRAPKKPTATGEDTCADYFWFRDSVAFLEIISSCSRFEYQSVVQFFTSSCLSPYRFWMTPKNLS